MNFDSEDEEEDEIPFIPLHGKSGPGLNISLKIRSTSSVRLFQVVEDFLT